MQNDIGPTIQVRKTDDEEAVQLVVIGASAGGVRALRTFFEAVPETTGVTFVVAIHLSPDHESVLAEVLQTSARIPVSQVTGRVHMEPDHVYVIPPGHNMAVVDGSLAVSQLGHRARRAPIDAFFRTVADIHPDSVAILLSGTGSDGTAGMRAIKERGGILMVQDPEEAEYGGMVRSATATGLVDFVLPIRDLPAKAIELATTRISLHVEADGTSAEPEMLTRILARVDARTGQDFTGYKRSTVLRRIGRRMQVTRTHSLVAYLEHLIQDDTEPHALRNDLLIGVTSFFRDAEAFEALEREVIPLLLPETGPRADVRVWVPGCSTGEEAYSLAMLLVERSAKLRETPKIQIFGTDTDDRAIAHAREGLYAEAIGVDVDETRLARFFRKDGAFWRVRDELREMVLFAPHNLLSDPPFSRIGLLSCRNMLIYLDRELQERAQDVFAYALRDQGYLFLGSSESLRELAGGFRAVDSAHRILQRVGPRAATLRHVAPRGPVRRLGTRTSRAGTQNDPSQSHHDALGEVGPPSILVDADHRVVHVGGTAARYLRFPSGTPSDHALHVVGVELGAALTAALHRAEREAVAVLSPPVAMALDGVRRTVRLWVAPTEAGPGEGSILVAFLESEDAHAETSAAPEADSEEPASLAERQLVAARDELQRMVRDADTREQDLQASNEELQSVNEEYRSTLEELETSKEELQSVNEELKISNDELNSKVIALGRANDDLRHLMDATDIAMVFLDRDLAIKRFTPALARLFNVVPTDTGRPLAHLTHKLDYPEFEADCTSVLRSLTAKEREVTGPDGTQHLVRVVPYRTSDDRIVGVAVTFTDVTRMRRMIDSLANSEARFRALVDSTAQIVWSTAPDGSATEDSPSWRSFTGQTQDEFLGWGWLDAVHDEDRERVRDRWVGAVAMEQSVELEYRLRHAPSDGWRTTLVRAVPVRDAERTIVEWVGMNSDITARKESEVALIHTMEQVERANRAKERFLATLSHELRTPLNAIIGYVRLLLEGIEGPLTEDQRPYLTRIDSSAWHLVSLIEEILTYSRTEAGMETVAREDVDLVEVVGTVAAMLEQDGARKGVEIRLVTPDALTVRSDGGKLRQIVTNLVGNAVKFTATGHVSVTLERTADAVTIEVSDTGDGIAAERLEEIFEPFVQVGSGPRAHGTGLGLTVCRRLVQLLGGSLEVESEPGTGSTFTVRLPEGE